MQEIWENIKGYEGIYQVSNLGNIKSVNHYVMNNGIKQLRKGNVLKKNINVWGYEGVVLYKNGIGKRHTVHRLVANAFINNPDNKKEINHIDGNKLNNCVSNLEWCTRSENMKHSYRTGLEKTPILSGKDNLRSKAIIQYDLNDNYIREFESMGMASTFLKNKSADRSISKCCNGLRKTAYGYKWRFKSE